MNRVVSNVGCDHDFVRLVRERFRDQPFAQAVAIGISGIEQGDTEVERSLHERTRFAFVKIPPPAGGNRPQTKANLANRQISVFVSAKFHCGPSKRSSDCRVESKPWIISVSASSLICSSTRM